MSEFIVITTIFPPTTAVRTYASMKGWSLVVVGDKKTPDPWFCDRAEYLSANAQSALAFELSRALPWNHYCRKMLGYLLAARRGAGIIVDTDDDNTPKSNWGFPGFDGEFEIVTGRGFVNIYRYFTSQHVWPRGLPLHEITKSEPKSGDSAVARIGVWQMLADGDPDVDALYRLAIGRDVWFQERAPVVLDSGMWCPFNSQNTAFRKELFPLLYLPSTVSFRFTDILRGWVAQPIMWQYNFRLGFGMATVVQDRNSHDLLRDFESELPMYLMPTETFESLQMAAARGKNVRESLRECYEELLRLKIVRKEELETLELWLNDLATCANASDSL